MINRVVIIYYRQHLLLWFIYFTKNKTISSVKSTTLSMGRYDILPSLRIPQTKSLFLKDFVRSFDVFNVEKHLLPTAKTYLNFFLPKIRFRILSFLFSKGFYNKKITEKKNYEPLRILFMTKVKGDNDSTMEGFASIHIKGSKKRGLVFT